MAQAQPARQTRPASPKTGLLPAQPKYDRWRGDFDITDPVKRPLDDKLAALCRRFATMGATGRSRLRLAASTDDFYSLWAFSRRSAVFAMRDLLPVHIVDGLTCIAMMEPDRIDARDVLGALSLLYFVGNEIGASSDDLFRRAAALAEPNTSELILGFLKRPEEEKSISKAWGYTVIKTKGGPGIVHWGFEPYHPTYSLDAISLALAQLLKQDKYQPGSITLADTLAPIWLSSVDDSALKRALASVRAVATIGGDLRPQESPDYQHQSMTIFVVELNDETEAGLLLQLARAKQTRVNQFALVAAKEGRMFCLAVARSFVAGVASFETQASVQRFSSGIAEILKSYSQK